MKLFGDKLFKILASVALLLSLVTIAAIITVIVVVVRMKAKCEDSVSCSNSTDLSGCECGQRKVRASRIVGGNKTVAGQWPFQVSLQVLGQHVCGGTLVSCSWVLSARHCFKNFREKENWTVVLGQHYLNHVDNENLQRRAIKRILNYNSDVTDGGYDYDIVLLELEKPAQYTDFIQAACLPPITASFNAGRKCVITGPISNELLEAEVELFSNAKCQELMQATSITERMICAGQLEGGVDTCQGDSGGPLLCQDYESRKWMVVGITSFGDGCGKLPGVYIRTAAFSDWIRETVFS
nr:PREDICTED: suppressor of tumorigenicity 14 protein-like isoform X2 [Latimeria chalumnae]|eukprot:XP_006012320.1 PREDICTED: suppressor of tumorigenicity 14 protein-like isoform X2 [Latimeria chalumnae]